MSHKLHLENPFPGLRAFRADEDYLFFGREEQTMELVQRLGNHRFVAVVGTSGSGKSSLVRCGLLSELLGGKMLGAGAAWEVAVTHPGGNPLGLLTEAILEADLYDREGENAREHLLATLSRSHFGLVEAVKQASLGEGTNFLLVVDQFEEIFRFHEAGQVQQEAANEFVSILLEAVAQKDVPIYVVLTMRSDFIGECGQFEDLAEMVNRGEFLIPRLTREQYKRIIEGPIKVAGGGITPRLLQRLLNDIGQQQDQLPCLQHALMRTWSVWAEKGDTEALDLDDYQRVGRMAEALSLHADEIYDSLADDRQRDLCRGMFQALTVQESESRGIRRPQRLSSLCQILEVKRDELAPIIDAFRRPGVTFLMPSSEVELTDQTIIDISHESLMRVWTRLRHWVEEEAQAAGIYRRLSESAALYHQGKAGLYRDPELGIALAWRESKRPNRAWAERYLPGFADAMSFLEASRHAAAEEEREKEATRQHELEQAQQLAEARQLRLEQQQRAARRMRVVLAGLAGVAAVAVVACVVALRARENARWNAEIANLQATAAKENGERAGRAQQAAEAALVDVEREKDRAEQNLRKAEAAELAARRAEEESRRLLYTTDMKLAPFVWKDEGSTAEQLNSLLARHGPVGWDKIASASAAPPLRGTEGGTAVAVPPQPPDHQVADASLSHPTRESTDKEDLRGFEWYYYRHLIEDAAGIFRGHETAVVDSGLTPSGQLVTLDERWQLKRWDVQTRAEEESARLDLAKGRTVQLGALARDGRQAALAIDKDVHLVDTATGEDLFRFESANVAIRQLAFSGDGAWLAIVDDKIRWCDTKSGKTLATLDHKYTRCEAIALSPDGLTLGVAGHVTLGGGFSAFRLDASGHRITPLAKDAFQNGTLTNCAISPDGKLIALAFKVTGTVVICETSPVGRAIAYKTPAHAAPMATLAFSPDGSQLATADVQGTIKLWGDPRKLNPKSEATATFKGHGGPITSLHFIANGTRLASTSTDKTVRIWESGQAGAALHPLASSSATWAQYSPDGLLIASAGDGYLRLWDAATGQRVRQTAVADRGRVYSVAFSPGNRLLAVGHGGVGGKNDSFVTLHDIDSGKQLARLSGAADLAAIQSWGDYGGVTAIAFSPDGKYLIAGFGSLSYISEVRPASPLKVWEVATQRLVRRLDGLLGLCTSINFSRDGALVAAASQGGTAVLWSTADWRRLHTLENPEEDPTLGYRALRDVAFSPDGKMLATASFGGSVMLWDVATGQRTAALKGHSSTVNAVAFSPDGRTLASGGDDQTVRLWNVAARRELLYLSPGALARSPTRRVAFSPDGSRLLATDYAHSAFWSAAPPIWDEPDAAAEALRGLLESGVDFQARIRELSENPRLHEALERLIVSPVAPRKDVLSRSESRQADALRVEAALAAARANWHASARRWPQAAEEFDRLKRLWTGHPHDWLRTPGLVRVACALVEQGDLAGAAVLLSGGAKRRIADGAETGLGIDFSAVDGVVSVTEVAPGSPAARAGLRPGDVVVGVNGVGATTDSMTWATWGAVNEQLGAKITLSVRHAPGDQPQDIVFIPQAFFEASNEAEWLAELAAAIDERSAAGPASAALLELRALIAAHRSDSETQVAECTAALDALAAQSPDAAANDLKRLYRLRGDAFVALKNWPKATEDYARGMTDDATDDELTNQALAEAETEFSRAVQTIVPTSESEGVDWRYTTEKPANDWNQNGFDDSTWREGPAPFAPPSSQARTFWTEPDIWLRRHFKGAPSSELTTFFLRLRNDDTVEVFLNGQRLAGRETWTNAYLLQGIDKMPPDLIQPGENTLAVHCLNKQGPGFIDVGLFATRAGADDIQKFFDAKTKDDAWLMLAQANRIAGNQPANQKLAERRPQIAAALGDLFAAEQNWRQAIDVYSKGLTVENDAELLLKRAAAYEHLQQWDEAAADWRSAAEGHPDAGNLLGDFARRLASAGQTALATGVHNQAREMMEGELRADPANVAVAEALGKLLLDSKQASPWTALKPIAAKSELGATLTILPDDSILASGDNVFKEGYQVKFTVPADIDLAAVRVEALTHPSLPNNGPGRSATGSFAQISWSVTAIPPGGGPLRIEFDDAWADAQHTEHPIKPNGHWNIWGGHGGNCTAIWSLAEPISLAAGTTLSFEMQCQNGFDGGENLGHFRLSVSNDQRAIRKQSELASVTTGDPWARLAAAYALQGNLDEATRIAVRVLDEADGLTVKSKLLQAIAQAEDLLESIVKARGGDFDVQLVWAKHLAEHSVGQAGNPNLHDLVAAREIFTRLHKEYPESRWTVLKPTTMTSKGGAVLTELADGSLLASGANSAKEVYEVEGLLNAGPLTAVRLEALRHESLPGGGISRGFSSAALTELEVEAASASADDWQRMKFSLAWTDDDEKQNPVANAIDGAPSTPWQASGNEKTEGRTAIFVAEQPFGDAGGTRLRIRLRHEYGTTPMQFGRFRLAATGNAHPLNAAVLRQSDREFRDCLVALGRAYGQDGRADESAEAFGEALELATDRAAKSEVIANAAALAGVLKKLADRAPDDAVVQAALARYYTEHGQEALADAARAKFRQHYERSLAANAEQPANADTAEALAHLLVESRRTRPWTDLKPVDMKSKLGTRLTLQSNGSVFADQSEHPGEWYTITCAVAAGRLAALRIEALPHANLPNSGPGWGDRGVFRITEVRARLERSGGESTAVTFRSPMADYTSPESQGPMATIDGDPNTRWDTWPDLGKAHWLALRLEPPVELTDDERLIVEIDFPGPAFSRAKLGCFRLSIAADTEAVENDARCGAVLRIGDPWLRLAGAYVLDGDAAKAARLLRAKGKEALAARVESEASIAGAVQLLSADPELERLSDEIVRHPDLVARYIERGRYLARLGRWGESADDLVRARRLEPTNHLYWLAAAPVLILAGDDEGYRENCRAMLEQFRNTEVATEADVLCKACALRSGMVDLADLPLKRLHDATEEASLAIYRPYFLGCCALVAYRQGNARQAIGWADKYADPQSIPGALVLTVRALAEHQLGRAEDARRTLARASELIPSELRTLGTDAYRGPLPVAEQSISHDWLIPELLRREASALIGAPGD